MNTGEDHPSQCIETYRGRIKMHSGTVKRQAAADYLKKLEEIGVLSVYKMGKENLYLNTKLYEILSK